MASKSETHGSRRVKYGVNVAIAIAAAVLVVIIINAIGYKRLYRVRMDMTATRRWSLSDQTTKVVNNLEGDYRIVMLISQSSEYHEQARDLIDEYGHLSGSLRIEEINPANESRISKFYGELMDRYSDQLDPVKQAIEAGRDAMKALDGDVKEQLALLRQVLDDESFAAPQVRQSVQEIAQFYAQVEQQNQQIDERLDEAMEGALPDYNGALTTTREVLATHEKNSNLIIDRLTAAADNDSTPTAVKDRLLRTVQLVKQTKEKLAAPLKTVQGATTAEGYGKLRRQIGVDTVVILGPKGKQPRIVGIEEMFKVDTPQQAQTGDQPEVRFLGEEKVTGALVAMSMTHQPMVVFVASGQQPAIGQRGQYAKVAERLRNMNFDVQEWSLTPRQNPMMGNQPMPPGPPPEPEQGQLAVWIVPPIESQANPFQQQQGGGDAQKVIEHLNQRLAEGDAVMLMATISQMSMFGMPDPMAQFAENFGVTAQTDRLIFKEMQTQDRRTSATPMVQAEQWPGDTPIASAMAGLSAVFPQSVPLKIRGDIKEAKVKPLAVARGEGLFEWSDLQDNNPRATDENSADTFNLAVTTEMNGNRMIVVGNGIWATDQVTTIDQVFRSPGLSPPYPAMFPGNTELFVNSVLWLAEMDDLIATTASTQDIRRIGEITPGGMAALRWTLLAGMPLLTILAGVGVWMIRRKS